MSQATMTEPEQLTPKYHELMQRFCMRMILMPNIEAEFAKIKSNADRVRYLCKVLYNLDCLPPQSWFSEQPKKNEKTAFEIRRDGNKLLLVDKQNLAALLAYNKALCFAPPGSEAMGISYANRSAIYFDAGFYKICLENIEMAFKNAYPLHLQGKLLKRRDDCFAMMKKMTDSEDLYCAEENVELSYPASGQVPFSIDDLKCNYNKKFGRHIIAQRNLNPGDVILIEKPYIQNVHPSAVYMYCFYCVKSNFFNLKPCNNSTICMFCSDECAQKAWNEYYKYESPVINIIYDLLGPQICLVHLTLKAFSLFKTPSELKDLIDSIDTQKDHAFEINHTQATEIMKFCKIYALNDKSEAYSNDALITQCSIAALLYEIFVNYTDFKEKLETRADEDLFMELLLRFYQVVRRNGIDIVDCIKPKPKGKGNKVSYFGSTVIGSGLSMVESLFNHSCSPNVFHLTGNGLSYVIVARPIKKNEQLFINYLGLHHAFEDFQLRQKLILIKYHFACGCPACCKFYPRSCDMKKDAGDITPRAVLDKIQNLLCNYRYSKEKEILAKEVQQEIGSILQKHDKNYPTSEIIRLYELFIQLFRIQIYKETAEKMFLRKK